MGAAWGRALSKNRSTIKDRVTYDVDRHGADLDKLMGGLADHWDASVMIKQDDLKSIFNHYQKDDRISLQRNRDMSGEYFSAIAKHVPSFFKDFFGVYRKHMTKDKKAIAKAKKKNDAAALAKLGENRNVDEEISELDEIERQLAELYKAGLKALIDDAQGSADAFFNYLDQNRTGTVLEDEFTQNFSANSKRFLRIRLRLNQMLDPGPEEREWYRANGFEDGSAAARIAAGGGGGGGGGGDAAAGGAGNNAGSRKPTPAKRGSTLDRITSLRSGGGGRSALAAAAEDSDDSDLDMPSPPT